MNMQLPDNVGEGQAPRTMRAKSDGTIITVPPPSKNWKDQMKRHKLLSNRDYKIEMVGDLKEIDSYVFQIRYMVKLQKAEGEHSDVIEAIDLKAASLTRNSTKLSPITIPNSADADAVEVLAVDIYVIDKTTGRQAALTTGRGNGDCALGLKFFSFRNIPVTRVLERLPALAGKWCEPQKLRMMMFLGL